MKRPDRSRKKGNSLVEFAMLAPWFFSLFTCVIDAGFATYGLSGASQIGGQPGVNLYGTIYAPRGAWTTLLGILPGDTIRGPLQVITGSLQMAVNTTLDVTPLPNPMTRVTVSLIQ